MTTTTKTVKTSTYKLELTEEELGIVRDYIEHGKQVVRDALKDNDNWDVIQDCQVQLSALNKALEQLT